MFMIFWIENEQPNSKFFGVDLQAALKFVEVMRQRKYAGEQIGFVTLSSENPDCVGKQGVDVTGPDYNWKKRR